MIQSVQTPWEFSQVLLLPLRTRQRDTARLRVMASDRAKLIAPTMSFVWVVSRLLIIMVRNEGTAMPSRTLATAIVTRSLISVKPAILSRRACVLEPVNVRMTADTISPLPRVKSDYYYGVNVIDI